MLNLDTNIVVNFFANSLSRAEIEVMDGQKFGICSIVLWELAKLKQLGRISFGPDDPRVLQFISETRIWAIDVDVAVASTRLDFRSDPADELIAATSLVHQVPLLTRDTVIRSSKIVPLVLR
jgi:PIN domain nuclease of toxin-antitoxin system